MPWALDNAEELAAEFPRTFFIPPRERRYALEPGDEVKLIFRLEREDGEVGAERMWVEVVETDPHAGLLRNTPQLKGVIEWGDRVEFGPEHVCGYAYTEEELGYDAYGPCFVMKRVADADEPPALLLLDDEGDWQAHALDETEEEQADSDNVLRWTLGYLTDRFPETEETVREGARLEERGVWWEWQGDRYVRRPR